MRTLCTAVLAVMVTGLLAVVAGCGESPSSRPSSEAKPPLKVGAIFAVSGPASFLGAPEEKTATMFVARINKAGGIHGRPIELIVKDSGGAPEKTVSLAKQLIDEQKVLAILGPTTSGETMAIKELCQEARVPLISCAAAETIVNPVASYVFKTPQKDSDAVRWIFRAMKKRGHARVGVITSNDGFGTAGKAQIEKLAPADGITVAISEVYDKQATDLTDVLTKLKGQQVQAVINWSIVPAQSLAAKNMKQIGLNVPLYQSHGFGNIKYAQASGEAANGTLFPCGRLLVADVLPDDHPQKKLLMQYKSDYENTYKEDVSTFGGHAYDAVLLFVEAARKTPEPTRDGIRDALETLRGVVGTAGVFNLSAEDHNGLAIDALELLTVRDGKFAIAGD